MHCYILVLIKSPGHQLNVFLSPWLSVLAGISPKQQPRHRLLRGWPLPVPEGNPTEQHITHLPLNISAWRFSFMQNCFFSASVNSGCSVCNSVAALKMSSCVRLGTNFNYRRPLFVPPRQSSSFQRALSSFYHCLYNIPCLSQTRRPIIEMISSPSNVHHDKHDSSDRIYSSLFIHRSMAWLGWRNMYWSGAL